MKRLVENLSHKELSYVVHGAAIEVRKDFGPGHKEKLYQEAFAAELKRRNIFFEQEPAIKIYSPKDGKYIGLYRPDFIADEKIIVETKAEKFVSRDEIKRIYDYLRNSKCELAYLVNFASQRLFVKRIIYTNDRKPFSKPLTNTNTKLKNTNELSNTKKLLVSIGLILVLFSGIKVAEAATLYFSPSSGNFTVGNILTTSVLINTQGQAINNSGAVINFPAGLLEVVSISKSGSIFSLWVEEPAFSNSAGTISFDGGLPTPGFNGTAGKIVNIVFRIRNAGTASLIFSSAAVRANDGYGTDILQTKAQAQFNLISEERPVVPPPALGTPQAPSISSPTHPDSNKWYAKSTATFNWSVSDGVTALKLLIGKIPTVEPIVLYTPPISKKTVDDLGDGVWYFHVQLRNDSGWGSTAHFKLQIDTKNPDRFNISLAPRKDSTDPKVKLIFDAHDETSGIDHYEIQIDGKESVLWRDDGIGVFETSTLGPGVHILSAKAVDGADNSLTSSIEFKIEPLEAPVITEYPQELESYEMLVVRGTTYENADVTVWIQEDDKTPSKYNVRSDGAGDLTLVIEKGLSEGVYKLWAEVSDERGARSDPSEQITIVVKQSAFLQIGKFAVGILSVLIPLIGLIIFLVFMLWYSWHKFKSIRKRVKKEIREAEHALHRAFDLLKEAIREQIKILEKAKTKRQLTEEEEKISKQLKKDLDDAEKFVRKEIEDIEKEVK
jgi:GxxExxY protein